jgi:hypothetical protein
MLARRGPSPRVSQTLNGRCYRSAACRRKSIAGLGSPASLPKWSSMLSPFPCGAISACRPHRSGNRLASISRDARQSRSAASDQIRTSNIKSFYSCYLSFRQPFRSASAMSPDSFLPITCATTERVLTLATRAHGRRNNKRKVCARHLFLCQRLRAKDRLRDFAIHTAPSPQRLHCADFRVFSLRVQGPQPLPPTAQVILPSCRCPEPAERLRDNGAHLNAALPSQRPLRCRRSV